MNIKFLTMLLVFTLPSTIFAQSIYCPQKQGYINTGMSETQVLAACGQPMSKQSSNTPISQKVPVKQFIYTNLNTGAVYQGLNNVYNQWSLPSGSTGVTLEVNVIDNKVSSILLNGSNTNAMSVCGGKSIQAGDPETAVISACGNPAMVNNTFINQIVPSNQKPEVWIYQVDQYQPPISLTFVNGKLQSID